MSEVSAHGAPEEAPLPELSSRMAPFWEAARSGELVLPRCKTCGSLGFPAFDLCNLCLDDADPEWIRASGRGSVFSFVVVHQAFHPYFAQHLPYAVADIKLAEGPRMISAVLDVVPREICVGMNVEITFVIRGELSLPMFRPVS